MRARNNNPPETCTVAGCDRKHHAKGKCKTHYLREWAPKHYRCLTEKQKARRREVAREYYWNNREKRLENSRRYRERWSSAYKPVPVKVKGWGYRVCHK